MKSSFDWLIIDVSWPKIVHCNWTESIQQANVFDSMPNQSLFCFLTKRKLWRTKKKIKDKGEMKPWSRWHNSNPSKSTFRTSITLSQWCDPHQFFEGWYCEVVTSDVSAVVTIMPNSYKARSCEPKRRRQSTVTTSSRQRFSNRRNKQWGEQCKKNLAN